MIYFLASLALLAFSVSEMLSWTCFVPLREGDDAGERRLDIRSIAFAFLALFALANTVVAVF